MAQRALQSGLELEQIADAALEHRAHPKVPTQRAHQQVQWLNFGVLSLVCE
jgi:hypothetical protein